MSTASKIQRLEKGGFDMTRIRALFYGESGSGKTVHASTWPDPLFLDVEDGMASVRLQVDRWHIPTWEDMFEALEFLFQSDHRYKTIVLDSLNELQKICMEYVVRAFPQVKRSYNTLPGMSDYGMMIEEVDKVVRALRGLPLNVVFLAQVAKREFNTDLVMPQMVGKNSAQNVCRLMDLVGYVFKTDADGRSVHQIAFNASDFVTKDRSGMLPPIHEIRNRDASYQELARYWEKGSR